MRTIALASALALIGGLSFAAPAMAGYYDEYGVYHQTVTDYRSDYYKSYDRVGTMSRYEIRRELEDQGYNSITNLHRVGFSDTWVATALVNGDWVRVTVDGDSGRVIDVDEI